MSYSIEPFYFNRFKGIREFNGVNSNGEISALTCSNVELIQSEIGNTTGIKTINGNKKVYSLPENYSVVEIFESIQENNNYMFIYGETEEKGTLFFVGIDENLIPIDFDFSVTGVCNGLTISSSAYDVFIFTNGKEVKTICFTEDNNYKNVVENHNYKEIQGGYIADIVAIDYLERKITWIAMTEWNGFLVVCSQYGIHSSHQNDIYTWNDNPEDIADSWYIDFGKKTTAIASFTGGLYIFTNMDVVYLNTTPNDTVNAVIKTVAMNGCLNYKSIVKHDTFLFFYDNNQKNIYYIQITDTGQTRPAGPVAKEIQSYFSNVKRFKMYSCIYNNRNEIWCIIDDKILIYDYSQNEWLERTQQPLNTILLSNNSVYSGDKFGNIYIENVNTDFSDVYYPSVYETTYLNINSSSNLKKQKTPLLLTLNLNYTNNFYIQLIVNSKEKTPKHIKKSASNVSTYVSDDINESNISNNQRYDLATYAIENVYNKTVVEISTPQTWYTLGIKIFTDEPGQGFFIQSMELKNIKLKTKTKGH